MGVKQVLSVSCKGGHAKLTMASPLRVVTGNLAAIPASRLVTFVGKCINQRRIRQVVINRPGRTSKTSSRGVGHIRPFIRELHGRLPSVPMRCFSRHFASILTRRTVLRNKLGGGSQRGGTLISRVDTAVVLRN